ncbi:hypothetical protein GQ55_3G298100 [Panicum hallii var. hallii]|uniref:Uncharacterized protein n=1 Tax=Panicum hallii var. hallii TaxID=1504633 RepID=A0A2T7EER5_9POAL|nr:hypothetical protein GQ55_3G298100 [Panicum hallii var. hallii]
MDATPLGKKAPPATAEGALPSAAQQAVERPSPDDAAAGVRTSGGGEDDDEQVERFYALLENIRAMRGMLGAGGGTGAATAAGRKRAREAEPPWRPAFRMEDFELDEVQSDAPCCDVKGTERESSCGARRPPAAPGRETTDEEEEEEGGEVVVLEAKCPRRAQRKARRAVVPAVDRLGSR